ncbi:hypothetical protein JCM24511_10100 [Saitozyma sp. JCM 24511]|nr:hypothetical protein JCM24511_10100 [Saitozyma sp. JCM 24511]
MSAFNVLYLGAGLIDWGHPDGSTPWNHSIRVEKQLGKRLKMVGLVDCDVSKAQKIISDKRLAGIPGYEDTRIFGSIVEAAKILTGDRIPRLALIGLPPAAHGTVPGRDAEIELVNQFPGIALFIEKPLSLEPDHSPVDGVAAVLRDKGTITSLSQLKIDLSKVREENEIPRLTNAIWRYENGACGSLLHGLVLHDGQYEVELVVMADGWIMRLVDPYDALPRL